MRIALFSDVHGNLSALEAVLAALAGHGPLDDVVCAGDMVFMGSAPAEVLSRLRETGVQMVRGNADDLVTGLLPPDGDAPPTPEVAALHAAHIAWNRQQLSADDVDLLRGLPLTLQVTPPSGSSLLVCHADPDTNNSDYPVLGRHAAAELRQVYGGAGAPAVAFGHWHQPYTAPLGDVTLVNVSCVSIPRDRAAMAGYTIAAWEGGFWSFSCYRVAYDLGPEVRRIRERGMPRPPWPAV